MAEFKIGRLRFTWAGPWTTGTFYNRDAVSQHDGKTYVCLVPHTSGNFNSDLTHTELDGAPTPYWNLVVDGKSWKGNWTPNTAYSLGNIIQYGGQLYTCTVAHTSGPSQITLADWSVYSESTAWKRSWATNTVYGVNDVVKYGGIVYKCISNHLSASSMTAGLEANQGAWTILLQGIEYKESWDSNFVRYKLNDIVKYGPDLWICTNYHTSSATFDALSWTTWLPGQEFAGTWVPNASYQQGDTVTYGGYTYESIITNNIGNVPSTSPDNWSIVTTSYELRGDWVLSGNYSIGDVVQQGGRTYVAIADNYAQDPSLGTQNAIYTASGSSGTTVKVSSTNNVAVGMVVVGTGFTLGQSVVKVVDNVTLQLSAAPDGTPVDTQNLVLTGVNAAYWQVLVPGKFWTSRWVPAITYNTGDIAVWQNGTYVCLQDHTSSSLLNRPDIDTAHAYWSFLVLHDRLNSMNTPGDIEAFNVTKPTAVPIGTDTYVVRANTDATSGLIMPGYSQINIVPGVYYVAPNGIDRADYGTTWDHPWKTIKHACDTIGAGTQYLSTKAIIADNKEFMVQEVYQWMLYQSANNNAPFSSVTTFDQTATLRDARYIVDAVVYDISRGGNSQIVAATLAYFATSTDFVNSTVTAKMPLFIAALNQLATLMSFVIGNQTVGISYQALNNVATPAPQVINLSHNAEAGSATVIAGLMSIVTTALTNRSTAAVPAANTGLTYTLFIKTGTYSETLPITIPENVAIVGDELRGVVVQPNLVIDTIVTRASAATSLFTALTTEGMVDGTPVQFAGTIGGVTLGQTYYVVGDSLTATQFSVSTVAGGNPMALTDAVGTIALYGGEAIGDMFYVRNGTGVRNMTLTGLLGVLGNPNSLATRRPTGGAYVSLDPGTGPDDTSAWIFRKSPYVQNVTNFGTGCVGLKIDGSLHNGGNKSVVCNDFTQILSDGIGIWTTGSGALCEAVSVFSYYNYSGYFAESGGKIRATNGNSSYGQYGVIAEGYDASETPITGVVYNRSSQVQASVQSAFGTSAQLLKLQFNNAGSGYNTRTTNVLQYSNILSNGVWATDGNVTLQQNVTPPFGLTRAWTVTAATSGTDGSYFYQDVTVPAAGATYTNLSGTNVIGSGAGATFDVTVTNTSYTVTVNQPGLGYVATNQIVIFGSALGGLDGLNDLTITVFALSGSGVQSVTVVGVVPDGSAQSYTLSAYVKKGTSSSISFHADFSGSSTVNSFINFNFSDASITPGGSNGFIPTQYGKVTLPNGWYRVWFAVNDKNGLNTNLRYKVYPRGYTGTASYSYIYGTQAELSGVSSASPSFYLDTTNTRYTTYANYEVSGAGAGAVIVGDELRSNAVFETRVVDPGTGAGGGGYMTASNSAQNGTSTYVTLSGADTATAANYTGMRIFINSGTGAGQYGFISTYNPTTKIAQVLKESFDTLSISNTTGSTANTMTITGADAKTLYVDQAVQFIPTYYSTTVTETSTASVSVSVAIGGSTNTLTVASTAQLTLNMAITFTGSLISNLAQGYTYYVYAILDSTTIQISSALYGTLWQLVTDTSNSGGTVMNYSSATGYMVGQTANMVVNYPIQFTGSALGGVTVSSIYYINDIIDSTTFSISSSLLTVTATNTTDTTNVITVGSGTATTLKALNPIVFSGTTFGNIVEGTQYYISNIPTTSSIQVSSTLLTLNVTGTQASTNLVTVNDTTGFVANNPIVFVGNGFGGLIGETTYYILAVNDGTTFTISQTVGGAALNLTTSSGMIYAKTCPAAFVLSTASGTMVGTSTSAKKALTSGMGSMNASFSTQLFGGVVLGTTYYINTIDVANSQFTITATQSSGVPFALSTKSGAMNLAAVGWDHLTVGTPIVNTLDSTSLYYIEPRTKYTDPGFTQAAASNVVSLGSLASWKSIAYGNDTFMAVPSTGAVGATSSDGSSWTSIKLPASIAWQSVTYGNKYWVAVAIGGTVYRSNSNGAGWRSAAMPTSTNWSNTAYGNGKFVAIAVGTANSAYSANSGATWAAGSGLPNATWTGLAYGAGRFVAVGSGTSAAYSTDGINWVSSTMPLTTTWASIAYGNGRFVAVSSTSSKTAYSFDGITWYTSNLTIAASFIAYGQGVFLALSDSTATGYTSEAGINWKERATSIVGYGSLAFGFNNQNIGTFTTLTGQLIGNVIQAGARAKGRAVITSGVITSISQWEPGSNYSSAPTVTFTDPNVTTLAVVSPRIGSGTLGNPTFVNRGNGYNTNSTVINITGNGYADAFQTGLTITMNNLTSLPQPGDDLTIAGNDQIYKVTSATVVFGTSAPNIEANVSISPAMSTALSPNDNALVTIREKYSQVRLTNHDFLNIGFGNFEESNYPNQPIDTVLAVQNQTVEVNYGRVFYSSTDQDGNFKVGSLFGVQQATGIVTLSTSQFGLSGLNALTLGGIAVGGSSVIVTSFSTDGTFVANTDSVIPTQKAIKTYLAGRLAQGGSNTVTGQLTAGTVLVGSTNKIGSTLTAGIAGSNVKMVSKVNFAGAGAGVDGDEVAMLFFIKSFNRR